MNFLAFAVLPITFSNHKCTLIQYSGGYGEYRFPCPPRHAFIIFYGRNNRTMRSLFLRVFQLHNRAFMPDRLHFSAAYFNMCFKRCILVEHERFRITFAMEQSLCCCYLTYQLPMCVCAQLHLFATFNEVGQYFSAIL